MVELTQEYLKSILHYNPETGDFTRLVRKGKRGLVGQVAGSLHISTGYWRILIDRREYLAHRLAWLYVKGRWPLEGKEIDHKDTNRLNNKFSNLREATITQNQYNRIGDGENKGTYYNKASGKFRASITVGGKKVNLGESKTREEARAVYVKAARELHGEFYYGEG
jgi:hypothetical protein